MKVKVKLLSPVQLFATPWTVAYQVHQLEMRPCSIVPYPVESRVMVMVMVVMVVMVMVMVVVVMVVVVVVVVMVVVVVVVVVMVVVVSRGSKGLHSLLESRQVSLGAH